MYIIVINNQSYLLKYLKFLISKVAFNTQFVIESNKLETLESYFSRKLLQLGVKCEGAEIKTTRSKITIWINLDMTKYNSFEKLLYYDTEPLIRYEKYWKEILASLKVNAILFK